MPKVTIDGVELEVPAGTTVLEAALGRGNEIPHYCYHPGLSIAGNCRMCLVEVEKAPKLVIGCYTPVADGMVVHTKSEKVLDARKSMMEFFLINHPLDCPICDEAGECRLQEYAVDHGTGVSRYTEDKVALSKAVDIGPHVTLDQERCIQCSRCIRFCEEVTGTSELAFFQRGERSQIGLHPGRRLENAYSGNVVDLCPVGALTLKEFRFQSRVWYLENTSTVCAGCARGCNVVVGVSAHDHYQIPDIRRIVPRPNAEVNQHWMCDEGRLSYLKIRGGERIATAQMPVGTEADWDDATAKAGTAFVAAAKAGRAAAILSPRLTTEDLFAFRTLFERAGDVKVGVRALIRGEDDGLLVRADKGANATGAAWVFGSGASEDGVLDGIRAGNIDVVLVVGDPLDPDDVAHLPQDARDKVREILFVGPLLGGAAEYASVLLPMAAWAEQDGSYVNFEGRVQWLRRARTAREEARPGWRVAADLAGAAGLEFPAWTSSGDVLLDVAAAVDGYEGLTVDALGMLGVPGKVGQPTGA